MIFMKYPFAIIYFTLFCTTLLAQRVSQNSTTVDHYLRLAKQNQEAGDIKESTRYLNEAATLVWEQKNYPDAIHYFNESIQLNQQINNESGISKIQSNLGMIYSDMQQYDESLTHFQQSLVFREKLQIKPEIISCRVNMSVILNNLKRHQEAAQNLEKALELATEMNDAAQMKSCYGMLAETYEKIGDHERTTHYFNLYRTFHEMIQRNLMKEAKKETEQAQLQVLQTELENKVKEVELLKKSQELYQTERQLNEVSTEALSLIKNNTKQELALSLLERESELSASKIQQAEESNQRQQRIIIIGGIELTAILALLLVWYFNHQSKKKLLAQLSEQSQKISSLTRQHESLVSAKSLSI